MREKWKRPDYRERTIKKAIEGCSEVYTSAARGSTYQEREPGCDDDEYTETRPAGNEPYVSGGELPAIDAKNGDLAQVTAQSWQALLLANNPPVNFRHGSVATRIETDDDGAPIIRELDVDRMRHRLARVARWEKRTKNGRVVAALPPLSVVKDVLACPDCPFPVLTRIVHAPIFAADGTLQTTPGYSAASRTFYAPAPGFALPGIKDCPSNDDVVAARELILGDLLGDFPFVSETERAHAVALLVLPFVRGLIDGPTPLHLVEASTQGTGKTLITQLLTYPSLGTWVSAMTEGKDDDEWRKRIFAKLRGGPSVVMIDNFKRRLESGAVASAITSWPMWEDRILTTSEIGRVPVQCAWVATGNNPGLSDEITRRTIRCRLDAKTDRPWLRGAFRHQDIRAWAEENRGAIVAAVLTLVRTWVVAGRPEGTKTIGMFEAWARVMGGILDVAGVSGFLGNLEEFYDRADAEAATWGEFVHSWWTSRGESEVKAGELWAMAIEAGIELGDKGDTSQKTRLGRLLRTKRDQVFLVSNLRLRLEADGEQSRAKLWRLRQLR
jgi:hypothetical protein